LLKRIDEVTDNFTGRLDDFYTVVGMVVVGRLIGWRAIRLVSSRRVWAMACKLFGDLKTGEIIPERGVYARKSVGLAIVDKVGGYWDIVKGINHMPIEDRKLIK
jgi:hypothetical protein